MERLLVFEVSSSWLFPANLICHVDVLAIYLAELLYRILACNDAIMCYFVVCNVLIVKIELVKCRQIAICHMLSIMMRCQIIFFVCSQVKLDMCLSVVIVVCCQVKLVTYS